MANALAAAALTWCLGVPLDVIDLVPRQPRQKEGRDDVIAALTDRLRIGGELHLATDIASFFANAFFPMFVDAGEMIQALTLIRNKLRQAAITKEISELVGGAEATDP